MFKVNDKRNQNDARRFTPCSNVNFEHVFAGWDFAGFSFLPAFNLQGL